MKTTLLIPFLIIATLYASVGFGGGSSYTALLVLSGAPFALVPILSLSCNILVVSGNCLRFMKAGLVDFAKAWPFLLFSVPLAWFGGQYIISAAAFTGLLGAVLLLSGLSLLLGPQHYIAKFKRLNHPVFHGALGGGLGFLSGIVGIGGGIFLAPILYLIGWGGTKDNSKKIAAMSSLFILLNSVFGLIGQLGKTGSAHLPLIYGYWPLALAVIAGGFIGNHLGLRVFSQHVVRKLTAILILFVAVRLLWEFYQISVI